MIGTFVEFILISLILKNLEKNLIKISMYQLESLNCNDLKYQ